MIVANKYYLSIKSKLPQRHRHQQNKHEMDAKVARKIQEHAFIIRHAFIIITLTILMMHLSEFSL